MVSLMASFVLSFFPLDVLDEIWDLIESVSEGFLTYSSARYRQIYPCKEGRYPGWFPLDKSRNPPIDS